MALALDWPQGDVGETLAVSGRISTTHDNLLQNIRVRYKLPNDDSYSSFLEFPNAIGDSWTPLDDITSKLKSLGAAEVPMVIKVRAVPSEISFPIVLEIKAADTSATPPQEKVQTLKIDYPGSPIQILIQTERVSPDELFG